MSVRDFNGTTDLIDFSIGAVSWAFGSIWGIGRMDATAAQGNLVCLKNGTTNRARLSVLAGRTLRFAIGASNSDSTSTISDNTWYLLGVSKATGSATPRFHWYDYSASTWTHENGSIALADATTTIDAVRLGASNASPATQLWDGRILAAAILNGIVLTDSEFENLAHSTALWFGGEGVTWKVALDQASTGTAIRDETGGGGDQSAITGTAIGTESHPMVP